MKTTGLEPLIDLFDEYATRALIKLIRWRLRQPRPLSAARMSLLQQWLSDAERNLRRRKLPLPPAR